jgi:hypothetical protein
MRRVVLLVVLAAMLAVVGWSSWTARASVVDHGAVVSSVPASSDRDGSLDAGAQPEVATPHELVAPTAPVLQQRARLIVAVAVALLLALLALGPRATAWVGGRGGRALPRRSSPLFVAPRRGPPARAARLLFS